MWHEETHVLNLCIQNCFRITSMKHSLKKSWVTSPQLWEHKSNTEEELPVWRLCGDVGTWHGLEPWYPLPLCHLMHFCLWQSLHSWDHSCFGNLTRWNRRSCKPKWPHLGAIFIRYYDGLDSDWWLEKILVTCQDLLTFTTVLLQGIHVQRPGGGR